MTVSELARNIEQWGLFRTRRKPGELCIRLFMASPDLDFITRLAAKYGRKIYHYPAHPASPYAVGFTQKPTAMLCAAANVKFGCEPHRQLARLLLTASDLGSEIRNIAHHINIRVGRPLLQKELLRKMEDKQDERARIMQRAFDILDEKAIYTACPVRAARAIDKAKQSMVQC